MSTSEENQYSAEQALRALGISGYYFAPMVNLANNGNELSNELLDKVNLTNRVRTNLDLSFIHFSDHNVKNCFTVFKSKFAESDPDFLELGKLKKTITFKVFDSGEPLSKKRKQWLEVMSHHGYQSRGVSIFNIESCKPLLGVFVFFSDKTSMELEATLSRAEQFPRLVSDLANNLMNPLNSDHNPWVALKAISGNSHLILQHLSEGIDTVQIAEMMHMSERGVNYHIERMKALLQAKNRTHLVAKALREGFIS
ncbi:response regulator transcription factor [Vibrio sp. THAF190c]|uniref:response regulator transcription factor n=1 Tax=Vibrio sp. THAF190c TaxID=2587865 RepID=UPI0012681FE4|nr:helix-turn-helix transcriptional regulator [Vibrio sp. THAF190c]QFT13092.1 Bacterial regulatory protein, LuxR family [Vibrio sp. THAF190c]